MGTPRGEEPERLSWRRVAAQRFRTVMAGSMSQGKIYWVDANSDIDDALAVMKEHQVKRLPVMEAHRLVGMISESDITRQLDESRISDFAQEVYAKH